MARRFRLYALVLMVALAATPVAYAQSEDVRALQQRLNDLGFDPGPIDGLMGPQTHRALRAFQSKRGLAATGDMTPGTLRALEIPSPNMHAVPAPQSAAQHPTLPAASRVPGRNAIASTSGNDIIWWAIGLFVVGYFVLRSKSRRAKSQSASAPSRREPTSSRSGYVDDDFDEDDDSFSIEFNVRGWSACEDEPQDIERYWHPPGKQATVSGTKVGDMIYVGAAPKSRGYSRPANWLIDPSLRVGKAQPDINGSNMPYWPSYAEIPPSCRLAYLQWLSCGRQDPAYGVGYVFLYFYGLEYRLFRGNPSPAERAALVAEVERLRSIYGDNGSFNRYSREFLDASALLDVDSLNDEPVYGSASWEMPITVKVGLGKRIAAGEPIDGAWMLSWWITHPETRLRTPARRAAREFETLFKLRFAKTYPDGYKVTPPKARLSYSYRAASGRFTRKFNDELAGCPDVSRLTKPVNVVGEIAESCMTDLDAFSRFLGRNPNGRATLEGHALLPTELAAQLPNAELEELRAWAENKIDQHRGLVPVQELLARLEGKSPERIARRSLSSAASALAHLSIGFAPDPAFALRQPKAGEPVQLFRFGENVERLEAVGSDYTDALVSATLGTIIAHADGEVSESERRHLLNMVDGCQHLSEAERVRLRANVDWMTIVPPKLTSLRKHFSDIEPSQKHAIGQLAIAVAASDGVIDPAEVKAVQKLYRTLELPEESVFSDIHALGGPNMASEPVTVRRPSPHQPTYTIPPAPEEIPSTDRGIRLDQDKISAIMADTAKVSHVLGEIFAEDEQTAPEDKGPDEEIGEETVFDGLDPAHHAFTAELLTRPSWTVDEFAQLASHFGLMADGARETINEWAFEQFDEPLIEEDEDLEVNPAIVNALQGRQEGGAHVPTSY